MVLWEGLGVLVAGFGCCWVVASTALGASRPVAGMRLGDREWTCFRS